MLELTLSVFMMQATRLEGPAPVKLLEGHDPLPPPCSYSYGIVLPDQLTRKALINIHTTSHLQLDITIGFILY